MYVNLALAPLDTPSCEAVAENERSGLIVTCSIRI